MGEGKTRENSGGKNKEEIVKGKEGENSEGKL